MAEDKTVTTDTLRNTTESSAAAIAQTEINSIFDSIPKLSLSNENNQGDNDIDADLDNIISEIKILEEREARAKEMATTATEFDKIRRITSRQKRDLVKKGQSLSFKEFQKLGKRRKERNQNKTN